MPIPAQADSAVSVGTTNFGAGVATNLGIGLTGFNESQSYQATVKFVNNTTNEDVTNGVLAATQGATALIAGYSSYSAVKLGFSGTYAAVADALSSVTWNPSNASGNISVRIGMASQAGANGFYDANSQHYYRYVSTQKSWYEAREIAENSELFGLKGYLAEIGSAAENSFIGTETSASDIWIGAMEDAETAANPNAAPYDGSPGKRWTWQGAIQTPLPTSSGASALGLGAAFDSWAGDEPNNDSGDAADCAVTNWGDGIGFWNDLPCSNAQSFLIEFGGRPDEASTASTRTFTATVVAKEAVTLGNISSDVTCTFDVDCSFPLSLTNPSAKNASDEDLDGTFAYTSSHTASTAVTESSAGASVSVLRAGISNITVTFTPLNTALYAGNSKSFRITVIAGNPVTATALRATPGNTEVTLSWTPGSNGGSDITDYIVEYSTNNSSWSSFVDGTSPIPVATVTGLTNGTLYYFRVTPISEVGSGPATTSVSATPAAPAPASEAPPAIPVPVATPSPTASPRPLASPAPSSTPRPTTTRTPMPADSPTNGILESGSPAKPAVLVGGTLGSLSALLKPVIVDVFANTKPKSPKLPDQKALDLVASTQDKKVASLPSLLLFDNEYQPTKLVILDKTIAQVIAPTGGVISVQAKNGDKPVAVSSSGRVQMLKNNFVLANGSGLAPNSEFAAYLFSTPLLLGYGRTNSKGEFFVTFAVQKDIPLGDHTLQVNGVLSDGRVSSVSMPVTVIEYVEEPIGEETTQSAAANVNAETNEAPYLFVALIMVLVLFVLFLITRVVWALVTRRKKNNQKKKEASNA